MSGCHLADILSATSDDAQYSPDHWYAACRAEASPATLKQETCRSSAGELGRGNAASRCSRRSARPSAAPVGAKPPALLACRTERSSGSAPITWLA